jgi:5-methylcytosine-specific restriction endonuclease McrA
MEVLLIAKLRNTKPPKSATWPPQSHSFVLKRDAAQWDLSCLICGINTVRLFWTDVGPLSHGIPIPVRCKHCEVPHLIRARRFRKKTLSVILELDPLQDWERPTHPIIFRTVYRPKKFSFTERTLIFRKTKGRCYLCQAKLVFEEYGKSYGWNIDHKFPRMRGGSNDLKNLWPACASCNHDKGCSTKREYLNGEPYDPWKEIDE